MAVHFKMVARKNNLVAPAETKYYPCAVSQGETDLERLADLISSRSTMSKADCYGVMIALTEAIGDALTEGHIVKILNLGTFQLTLQGTGAETPEGLGKSNISSARIAYKPAKAIKEKLNDISYKRIK